MAGKLEIVGGTDLEEKTIVVPLKKKKQVETVSGAMGNNFIDFVATSLSLMGDHIEEPTKDVIAKLLESSGVNESDILQGTSELDDLCKRYIGEGNNANKAWKDSIYTKNVRALSDDELRGVIVRSNILIQQTKPEYYVCVYKEWCDRKLS